MSPRPGFVLEVDRSTPPTLFWHGEGYRLERLPVGSRVLYAPEPFDGPGRSLAAPFATPCRIPWATALPLPALLFPGMRLTIAFDDVSLPLPPMRRPDIRQLVIEQVLEMAAEAGVDDVVLIAALALHRRMTDAELRHALGDRVDDAFAPHGPLQQHDAEDPDNLIHLGQTDQGEEVELNKRAATSDLLVYVNINLVAMDGGHKSVATGLASYRSLRHHHNARTMHEQPVVHGPAPFGVALVQLAHGEAHRRLRSEGVPDRDHPQQRHVSRAVPVPPAPGVGMVGTRPGGIPGELQGTRPHARQVGPVDLPLHQVPPPDVLGPSGRSRGRPCRHDRQRLRPAARRDRGPKRHLDHGASLHLSLQRELDHEPDPGGVLGARLLLQPLPGQARSCAPAAW